MPSATGHLETTSATDRLEKRDRDIKQEFFPIYSNEDISLADISGSKEKLNILSTLSPTTSQEIRMKRSNNKHIDEVWGDR